MDWADRLRSDGRDVEARAQLRTAFALACRYGYHSRTGRIVADLAALGDHVVAAPDLIGRLTGQELAVAARMAGGASVAEAAAELFLSVQTVEQDLREVCRKLGVTELGDLAAALAGDVGGQHDPAEHPGWFIGALGQCRIRRDCEELPVPAGRAGTLLHLLVALGGSSPVDEVIEHLWPEVDPDVGRVRIRNVLTRLRRAIGDVVLRDGDALVLGPAVRVDVLEFRAEASEAMRAAAAGDDEATKLAVAAVRWYGGDLLPEARYEPWAEAPRGRLRRRYLELLDLLAADARRSERWDEVARYVELAIETDPDDHDRYLAAAAARLRQGRRSTALRWCRRAREAAAELGVPSPAGIDDLEVAALVG